MKIVIYLLSFLYVLLLASCGNPKPTFYLLNPIGIPPQGGGLGIGVGPVSLAEYVDRENLVIQTGPNEIQLAESHLWAGDLDASVERVLASNLGFKLRTGNVRTYPWRKESEIDFQVIVDIRQFLAGADGYASMEAAWRVYALPGSKLLANRTYVGRTPIATEDYAAVVAAQSVLLGELSEVISQEIRRRR